MEAAKAKERYRTLYKFVDDECVANVLKFCKEDDKLSDAARDFCIKCLEKETIYGFDEILQIAIIYGQCIPVDLAALFSLCQEIHERAPRALSETEFNDLRDRMLNVLEDVIQRCPDLGKEFQNDAKRSLVYRSNYFKKIKYNYIRGLSRKFTDTAN